MQIGEFIYYIKEGNPWIQRDKYMGETSRSWLIGYAWRPTKLPKKTTKFVTVKEWDEQTWVGEHRYKISNAVQRASVEQLKKIAEVIGYQEEK